MALRSEPRAAHQKTVKKKKKKKGTYGGCNETDKIVRTCMQSKAAVRLCHIVAKGLYQKC